MVQKLSTNIVYSPQPASQPVLNCDFTLLRLLSHFFSLLRCCAYVATADSVDSSTDQDAHFAQLPPKGIPENLERRLRLGIWKRSRPRMQNLPSRAGGNRVVSFLHPMEDIAVNSCFENFRGTCLKQKSVKPPRNCQN